MVTRQRLLAGYKRQYQYTVCYRNLCVNPRKRPINKQFWQVYGVSQLNLKYFYFHALIFPAILDSAINQTPYHIRVSQKTTQHSFLSRRLFLDKICPITNKDINLISDVWRI